MKYLFILLASCSTYTGVIVTKGTIRDVNAKIDEYHYVMPYLEWDEYDSLKIGDTIRIDKHTLRVIR